MKIKEFFYSINLRGNKIINAKTDTPVNPKDITPKDYVDSKTTYDTQKANDYSNSFKFPWVQNVLNKSFKELFDDLFFPQILPTYINPTFYDLTLSSDNLYNVSGSKKAIFEGKYIQFTLGYKINPSDRISGITPKIVIKTVSGDTTEINGTETSDTSGSITFVLLFRDILSISLVKSFQQATVIKNDSYGIPYIPTDFTIDYDLSFDVFNLINKTYNVYPPIVYYKVQTIETPTDFINTIMNGGDLSSTTTPPYNFLIKDTTLNLLGSDNMYVIGIPEPLFSKSNMVLHHNLDKSDIPLNILDINFNGETTYAGIRELTYFGKNVKYFFGYFDFGTYTTQTKIEISFNINKS